MLLALRLPGGGRRPFVLLAAGLMLLLSGRAADAQQDTAPVQVTISVRSAGAPLPGATVRLGGSTAVTGSAGTAVFRVPRGTYPLRVEHEGHRPLRRSLPAPGDTQLNVALEPLPHGDGEHGHAEELEGIVVTATRSEQRIEDVPVRVEVLGREEVEEKMLMTPGDIAMMLNETSGLRVQTTSPSLGGAGVRVQGLRGRYTQILSDGLPLYGGQSGALGLLQIPPMDLGQVEVVKGAASALYGASALGGVVNLVSRRPADEPDRELLLNASTLGGADAVLWSSGPLGERWGYTFLGSGHRQGRADVDDDGWADLPAYRRAVLRPRLFWNGGEGRSALFTVGATAEERDGGGRVPGGAAFAEALETARLDGGTVGRFLLAGDRLLTVRGSGMVQRHAHRFGGVRERDLHATWFAEAALGGASGAHTWVVGAALQRESYDARDVAGFDYAFTVPALFAQDDFRPAEWLALTASARLDAHSEYGTFFSPRVSALLRPVEGWSLRASAGTGFFAPTPFTEETEAVGLARLQPLEDLRAERARTASLDLGRTAGEWELNATLFGSVVDAAVQLRGLDGGSVLRLENVPGATRTWGTELLARWHRGPLHATATHAWIHSTEPDPERGGRRDAALVPRHAAGVVGMWEDEGNGRVGVEVYYTGRQALEDNPYRAESRRYVVVGMLVERRVGRARVFLNAENLGDARQTRWDPLLLPARSAEGRWTTDAWAPLEGRTLNGGVRLEL
ncbi:MAG TPA: TonB-dependent receptor [Longimicrobiaceae bacterium]|nr:TonB-dependent receptor [Longimicrobiaceae bacterium]